MTHPDDTIGQTPYPSNTTSQMTPFHYGPAESIHLGSWDTSGCAICTPTSQTAVRYCWNCGAEQ